jgi:hypothetical protein
MTRSIMLVTPNGLPQRVQGNGSSSLSTREVAVAAWKSMRAFLAAGVPPELTTKERGRRDALRWRRTG